MKKRDMSKWLRDQMRCGDRLLRYLDDRPSVAVDSEEAKNYSWEIINELMPEEEEDEDAIKTIAIRREESASETKAFTDEELRKEYVKLKKELDERSFQNLQYKDSGLEYPHVSEYFLLEEASLLSVAAYLRSREYEVRALYKRGVFESLHVIKEGSLGIESLDWPRGSLVLKYPGDMAFSGWVYNPVSMSLEPGIHWEGMHHKDYPRGVARYLLLKEESVKEIKQQLEVQGYKTELNPSFCDALILISRGGKARYFEKGSLFAFLNNGELRYLSNYYDRREKKFKADPRGWMGE